LPCRKAQKRYCQDPGLGSRRAPQRTQRPARRARRERNKRLAKCILGHAVLLMKL
jgi:hypothetical protein